MNKVRKRIAKELLSKVLPALIAVLPIAQLMDVQFVTDVLGKWGLPGVVASILAGYVVAYLKESPLGKAAKEKKPTDLTIN